MRHSLACLPHHDLQEAEQRATQHTAAAAKLPSAPLAPPDVDYSDGLEQLEQHMIALSNKCRVKDQEIRTLQATVHSECLERTQLLGRLKALEGR
jgi:hypothetical protein